MPDLEVGIEEVVDTPAVQAPEVAEDSRVHQVEGGTVASNMNPGQKMWLAYWLLGAAASVIFLNNHIDAATKDQLFPPELSMFVVFLCAICLILRAMKQHR
ncbi:hypothetical protein PVAP13_4KG411100 [Panicum virgatum]|uniref:Uncharacterized protein n=1 Tax=Panicum virgatum TaxID=38727 RepID=A0A8T0TV20_PANVG|nr:hypothetical protein PVAP13_4KG411100 [Panicum virgatum]